MYCRRQLMQCYDATQNHKLAFMKKLTGMESSNTCANGGKKLTGMESSNTSRNGGKKLMGMESINTCTNGGAGRNTTPQSIHTAHT